MSKILFAPNCHDLIILTATSKLKFFRLGLGEITEFKDIPNIHDYECLDFCVSHNNKYIFTCGKDGQIRVWDYFMRGTESPVYQGFVGHYSHA